MIVKAKISHVGTSMSPSSDRCIIKRADGVYIDPAVLGNHFIDAVNNLFHSNAMFRGLDYPVFIKAMYDVGPDLKRSANGEALVRFAADIVPFAPERRALYKAVKIGRDIAEYHFAPVFVLGPQGEEVPARLDLDEFIADVWNKGIRFGLEPEAIHAAIAGGKSARVTVARRLEAQPGIDAQIVEVSTDIHRSDAPRQLANGKLDLMAFQNRFPQIACGVKLLQKVARRDGLPGFDLNGTRREPALPKDLELSPLAGPGTVIEMTAAGEFLVAIRAGFLSVDSKNHQLAISDKIVSRDGVSARTTGNLQLTGDYEEFGEVQEKRLIEGDSITIHADVFGNIVSRGGRIVLNANLVGGSSHNRDGDIQIHGVASGAVVQTKNGHVTMARAESCIISGSRVTIDHASNCEIIADEVVVGLAEGCAIAGRRVTLERAGPRKQSEMLVFALVPDQALIDAEMLKIKDEAEACAQTLALRHREFDALVAAPDVRQFMLLQHKVRTKEITLTPEQQPAFQKMALAIGAELKTIAVQSNELKICAAERQALLARWSQLAQQKYSALEGCTIALGKAAGTTQIRMMPIQSDGAKVFDLAPKDIKLRLRGQADGAILFSDDGGGFDWQPAA